MSEDRIPSFEDKLDRIDSIIKQLETNNVPLERAVELFKEGKALSVACERELATHQASLDNAMGEGSTPI